MSETYFVKAEKKDSFTILDTTCIRDSRLSMKAKGLHTYLMSLPSSWKINLNELKKHFSDGKDSINSAIKELTYFGYFKKETQERLGNGQFASSIFYVYEKPIEQNAINAVAGNDEMSIKSSVVTVSEKPSTDNPSTENPTLLNIDRVNIKISNTETNKNLKETTTSTKTSEIKNFESQKTEVAEPLQKIYNTVKALFDNHYVFDSKFVYELSSLQKEFELSDSDFKAYIDYVYTLSTSKNPNSLTNMFYRLAKTKSIVQDFLIAQEKENAKKRLNEVVCPVCGSVYKKGIETCPICEYDFESADIEYYKSIFTLSDEQKAMFKNEEEKILTEKMKYSVITLVQNKALADSFNKRLNILYEKYGIKRRFV